MTTTKQRNKPPAAGATQTDTLAAMQILLAAGVPVLLWGDPGTGKTHTIEAFARRAGWGTVSVIASIHDPTDFAGLPLRTDAGGCSSPPHGRGAPRRAKGRRWCSSTRSTPPPPLPRTHSCGSCSRAGSGTSNSERASGSPRRRTRRHRTARRGISARRWRTGSRIWTGR